MTVKPIEKTPSAYAFPLLIKNLLRTPLVYAPDQEIIYRDQLRYTYTDFGKRVSKLASGLRKLGVKPGDTVAIMDWDSHRYLECFFAVPMMGAVLHTINVRLSPEQLRYTINHAEDDVILVNSEFLPMLEGVQDQFTTEKAIILISDDDQPPETSVSIVENYETLVEGGEEGYDFPDFDEDTKATTFYTTGTTGLPKGVYFSHRQLVLHTYGAMTALGMFASQATINASDVYMPVTPMFHVHAWGMPYLMTLLGAKQVYPGRYEPAMLLNLIEKEKVTFSHCVPTILHMIINSPVVKDMNLEGWKVIIGGSALSHGLCKAALEMGINLYTGYGMSETCPVLTIANLKPHMLDWGIDDQVAIRCRTGLPIPNVQIEVVDFDGNPQPHDGTTTGEVVVRAPWLTQGYLKEPEKSEELWENGWLHTGDVGFIDPEGYVQITDRLKDVIKTGGEWISSLELENIISQHPAVSESAVIGIADEKWGERPMALIVLKEDCKDKLSEAEVKDFFMKFVENGAIPKFGVPNKVLFVPEIVKTSVGKINKREIRSQYR